MSSNIAPERLEQFCYTKKDFVFDWFSGTGKGGQHRNKHQNCLRLKHIPSGIVVLATEGRDRPSNQRMAFKRLKPQLERWIIQQLGEIKVPINTTVVRTYNEPDNRVKDHISGKQILWSELDKRFGELIDSRKEFMDERITD